MTTETLKAEDALAELKEKRRAISVESSELHAALALAGEDGLAKKARIEKELAALATNVVPTSQRPVGALKGTRIFDSTDGVGGWYHHATGVAV